MIVRSAVAWVGIVAALCCRNAPPFPSTRGARAAREPVRDITAVKHTIVDKARMLRGVPLLSEVSTEVLADLAALSAVEHHEAGTVLYTAGEPADAFFLVITGEVRVLLDDEEAFRVADGGELGALAVLDERPRGFTAVTASACQLLRLGAEDFLYLLEQHPRLARGVIRYLAREARASLTQRSRSRTGERSG